MAMDHERSEDFAKFYATARPGRFRAICAAVADPGHAQELTAKAFVRAFAH